MWYFGWFSAYSWTCNKLLGGKTSLVKQRTYWNSGKKKGVHHLWKEGKITWGNYRDAGRLCREKLRRAKPPWSLIWLLLMATQLDIFWVCAGDQAWGTHYSVLLKKKKVDRTVLSQPTQFWGGNSCNYQTTSKQGCLRKGADAPFRVIQPGLAPWLMCVSHERVLRTNLPAKTWGGDGFCQCRWGCVGSPIQITTGKGALQILWSETCQPVTLQAKLKGRLDNGYTVKVWRKYWVCFYPIITRWWQEMTRNKIHAVPNFWVAEEKLQRVEEAIPSVGVAGS